MELYKKKGEAFQEETYITRSQEYSFSIWSSLRSCPYPINEFYNLPTKCNENSWSKDGIICFEPEQDKKNPQQPMEFNAKSVTRLESFTKVLIVSMVA